MEIWLSWQNNKERFQLPVNTFYTLNSEVLGEKVSVSSEGMLNLIGKQGLKEISIKSFFPKKKSVIVDSPILLGPFDYISMIEGWCQSEKPIRLIITETPINLAMKIDDFSWGEEDGTGDIYFNLNLSEYIFTAIETVSNIGKNENVFKKEHIRESAKELVSEKEYVVSENDSLFKIAKKTYGDGKLWREIYLKNKETIGGNPNIIKPNQRLVLPVC